MSDWLEELEHTQEMCDATKYCKDCKLGRCIKPDTKNETEVSK